MSKIFETNFENSSFLDKIGGSIGILSGTPLPILKKTIKGLGLTNSITNSNSLLNFSSTFNFNKINGINKLSIFISGISYDGNFGFTTFATNGSQISIQCLGTTIYFINYNIAQTSYGTVTISSLKGGKAFFIYLIFDGTKSTNANKLKCCINTNIIQSCTTYAGTIPTTVSSTLNNLSLLNYNSVPNAPKQSILKCILYNDIVAQTEITARYLDFLNPKFITKPTVFQPNLNILKPSEQKDIGLVAAYNFQTIGNGKLINVAADSLANNYNARQYDISSISQSAQITKDSIRSLGRNKTVNIGVINLGTSFTIAIAFRYRKQSGVGNETLLLYSNDADAIILALQSGNLTSGSKYTTPAYTPLVNGAIPVSTGDFVQTLTAVFNNNSCKFYLNGIKVSERTYVGTILFTGNLQILNANYTLNGDYLDYRIYNRAITDKEAKNYHNSFASKVVIEEDFSNYPVNATKFNNYKTNSVSIVEETSKSKQFNIGTKSVKQNGITTSYCYIPSNTITGTWEFSMKFLSTISSGFYGSIMFNGSSNSALSALGYFIAFYNVASINNIDTIKFSKGLTIGYGASTVLNTISMNLYPNIWYRIKMTRTTAGLYKIYIDNILIMSGTDTTYSTSSYFMISPNYYTKYVTNIKISQGITI